MKPQTKVKVSRVVFADASEAVEAARRLIPALADRAQECEQLGRCPDQTIADLHACGLMRMMQPKRFGGSELGADAMFDVVLELAKGCGSTAWVWFNLASHSWNIGQFNLQAQEDVWAEDPHALAAAALAFPCGKACAVEGGYVVSGTWPFGSGIDAAGWHMVGALLDKGADVPPGRCLFLVPRSDFESRGNWTAYGLAGTGSHDVSISDAFVPAHRMIDGEILARGVDVPGNRLHASPWYRVPTFSVSAFALVMPLVGMAKAAVEDFVGGVKKRTGTYTKDRLAELAPLQMRIAEAAGCVDFAEQQLRRDIEEMMTKVRRMEEPSIEQKVTWRRNCAMEAQLCVRAIDSLMVSAGAAGLSRGGSLQRHFRDIHAGSAHFSLTWDVQATLYGRHRLGLPLQGGLLI